jgi:2-polyprenyl-3-methyl-5-hydroxy-6-metoxy-1,4-benzoquinol methylase
MKRWYEISKDPNSLEVVEARKKILLNARSGTLIKNRIAYLCDMVKDKDVLDIGVVEHLSKLAINPNWLHRHLAEAAKTCLGVDILEEEVEKLHAMGFNVLCVDLTKKHLEEQFDVIVCGEVLEHVDSPKNLLLSATKMLKPNGRIVISVPNPWYVNILVKNVFDGPPYIDNADHVAWFDPCTLCELGQRCGLLLDRFSGVAIDGDLSLNAKIFFNLTSFLPSIGIRPEIFAKVMIYEFVAAQHNNH